MANPIPLRILCLHDAHSNAPLLKDQLAAFGEKLLLEHDIDMVYVNSPIVASPNDDFPRSGEEEGRVWWEEIERMHEFALDANHISDSAEIEDGKVTTSCCSSTKQGKEDVDCVPKIHYLGLDASLMLLKQIWTSAPFFGILGVGQGAAVASLFMALLDIENLAVEEQLDQNLGTIPTSCRQQLLPQLAVFVMGESLVPADEPILDTTDVSILHMVNAELSEKETRLCRQLPGRVEHRSAADTSIRNSTENTRKSLFNRRDFNIMGRFLVEQKKRLFGFVPLSSDNNSRGVSSTQEIVALQTALHLAEQQAADAIADVIALKPPASLMAVIRPQQVAGWNGTKRRAFGTEGGGAPCPSEFLLNRQQRANQSSSESGPSRVHPDNKVEDTQENQQLLQTNDIYMQGP